MNMKFNKKILRIMTFLFIFIICNTKVKATTYNGSGNGGTGGGGGCPTGETKLCQYYNGDHTTIEVELYHYNGEKKDGKWVGNPSKRTSLSKKLILTTRKDLVEISGAKIWKFDSSFKGDLSKNSDRSFKIDTLKKYFSDKKFLGITLHGLLENKLSWDEKHPEKTVDSFNDWVKKNYSIKYADNFNSGVGGAYGFRLVIRPILSFRKTKNGDLVYLDAGGIVEANNKPGFINKNYVTTLPCLMYLQKNDVGYKVSSSCKASKDYDGIKNETSFMGINILTLDAATIKKETRCNPDAKYGNTKGIDKCCKDIGLKYTDFNGTKSKNTTKYLTRVITKDELKGTVCDDRCKTNNDSNIKTCCNKYGITIANKKNNNTGLLTAVISDSKLKQLCPTKCKKDTAANIKKCCESNKITYLNQTNNVGSLFEDNTKLTSKQLLDNCDDRCNTNTKDGIKNCCTKYGITYRNVGSNKYNNTTSLTKKLSNTDLIGTSCDNRCDPKVSANGKDGITNCCKTVGITYTNDKKNTTSYLKSTIAKDDLLDKCDTRCDPDDDGVSKCCEFAEITYTKREGNTTKLLTRKLTDKELEKDCDDRCDTTSPSGIANCCKKHNITLEDVTNNNEIVLKNKISDEDLIKYCDPGKETRCNKNIDGIKTCCKKYNITPSNKNNNTTENLTEILTDEEIEDNCYTDDECDYDFNSNLPTHCDDIETNEVDDEGNKIIDPGNSSGEIFDNTSWKCIFKSTRSSNTDIKSAYIASSLDNPYCAIYCKQEVQVDFPSLHASTTQGRYLTVNLADENNVENVIKPVETNSTVTCRTTGGEGDLSGKIGVERFEKAYKYLNDEYLNWFSKYKSTGKTVYMLKANMFKTDRDKVLSKFRECYNITQKSNGIFNPGLILNYKDPSDVYSGDYNLKAETVDSTPEIKAFNSGSALDDENEDFKVLDSDTNKGNTKLLQVTNCSPTDMQPCKVVEDEMYPTNLWYETSYSLSNVYTLADNVNRYVSKTSTQTYANKKDSVDQYIDLGVSTLPVHYSTLPGTYDYTIRFVNNGTGSYITKLADTSKIFKCSYDVTCEKLMMIKDCAKLKDVCPGWYEQYSCETGVLSTIYREISLYEGEAFLNANGTERNPGSNWNALYYVENNIYKNRGVESYELYQLDPMYEVTLTPKKIHDIRQYNEEMNEKKVKIYDETSLSQEGVSGYSSYDGMTCTDGKNCISSKIREWGTTGCSIGSDGYTKCNPTP